MSKKKRKKKKKAVKLRVGRIIVLLCVIVAIVALIIILVSGKSNLVKKEVTRYLASNENKVTIYTYDKEKDIFTENGEEVRGTKIRVNLNDEIEKDNHNYFSVTLDDKTYYIDEDNLVSNKDKVVLEKEVFTRTPTTILEDMETSKIMGFANKGDKLEVTSYDGIDNDGNALVYKVKSGDAEGYVYGKYMVINEEDASKNYESTTYDPIHSGVKNSYGGGEAIGLDFYPVVKPKFEDNVMPEAVYSLYLNSGVLGSVDRYIEYAKTTKINAFVVDIVDDTAIGYESNVMKEISPTSYSNAISDMETFKTAIKKIKDAGFYVIGRITVFKDTYYVKDHPEDALSSKATGSPFYHNSAYWPSAYSRNIWYYKVALAKEAVKEMGFNEINFDYVRFPDRMTSIENSLDMHNTYNESKVQAIQRFVQYATDEIHKLNAYVSIDVFGESVNGNYTTAYGQYFPAISNVCDVISGMPYPDHFAKGSYGIAKPWNSPYELLKAWGEEAYQRSGECPTPAVVRTWIQAYDVLQYVDSNGISYNGEALEKEIRGLYDAKVTGGYITWNSASSLEKYRLQKSAFDIDYAKEYGDNNEQTDNS